jgi:molybdopterin converting factor small subunit
VPRVVLAASASRALAGGAAELVVEATNFRRLVVELECRFPGLGRQVEQSMAVAIDGVIYQDAYDAPLGAAAEVVLIPKIAGG